MADWFIVTFRVSSVGFHLAGLVIADRFDGWELIFIICGVRIESKRRRPLVSFHQDDPGGPGLVGRRDFGIMG